MLSVCEKPIYVREAHVKFNNNNHYLTKRRHSGCCLSGEQMPHQACLSALNGHVSAMLILQALCRQAAVRHDEHIASSSALGCGKPDILHEIKDFGKSSQFSSD